MGEGRKAPATRLLRSRALTPAALMVVLAVTAVAGPAGAEEVTAGELHELVQRASSDPAALSALRRVDRVDGRPVDLDRALAGASGPDLDARLRALDPGASVAAGPRGGDEPRDQARRILEERRFHPGSVPRPFRGVFRTLGRWLRPLVEPLERAWSDVFDNAAAVGALGAGVVGLAALASLRVIRRRSSAGVERVRRARDGRRHADPDELERRAVEAERAGHLDAALRLRFRAGLLRLDRAGVVADRPALTTGALTRELPSPLLRDLAAAFEEVAYGGRTASPDDLAAARAGWPRVLEEVAR